MATSKHPSQLRYAFESTAGTGPADASAWDTAVGSASTGGSLRHIATSLNTDALKQSMIEDERSQVDVLTQELKIHGIRGGVSIPFEIYLHGTGVLTADTDQVADDMVGNFLEHVFGGQQSTYSTTATGGSTTTAVLDATTGIDEGVYLAIQDNTSPIAAHSGRVYIRQVASYNSGTSTVTFDEALPFAVSSGDIVHGCRAYYIDESVLVDSTGASNRQLSWHIMKGLAGATEAWELHGCVSELASMTFNRNAAPTLAFNTHVASYVGPGTAVEPSFTDTPFGFAPQAIGPSTSLWMADTGSTTSTQFSAISVGVAPGLVRTPVETVTEATSGMPGRGLYSIGKSDCMATIHFAPYTATRLSEFLNDTEKQIRYAKAAAPGSAWAVHFPRCQVVEEPTSMDAEDVMGVNVAFRAMQRAANSNASNTALWRSRMVLIQA